MPESKELLKNEREKKEGTYQKDTETNLKELQMAKARAIWGQNN